MVYCAYGVVSLASAEPPFRTMPFLRIPLLAQNKILRMADPLFRVQIALTSRRMEWYAKNISWKKVGLVCVMEQDAPEIIVCDSDQLEEFTDERRKPECFEEDFEIPDSWPRIVVEPKSEEEETIEGAQWADRRDSSRPNRVTWDVASTVKNTAKLLTQIHKDLRLSQSVYFRIDQQHIRKMLRFPIFKEAFAVEITGDRIDSETLSAVLDSGVSKTSHLHVRAKMPSNFRHQAAFSRKDSLFEDSRWVRLQDVVFGEFASLTLGKTRFSNQLVNSFLRKFQTCGSVVQRLMMEMTEDVRPDVVLEGIVLLYAYIPTLCDYIWMVSSRRPATDNVGTLGLVHFYTPKNRRRLFYFTATTDECFPGKRAIMQTLHHKSRLEKERKDAEQAVLKCERVIESRQQYRRRERSEALEKRLLLRNRITDISRELVQLVRKLDAQDVYFYRGQAVQERGNRMFDRGDQMLFR